MLQKICNLLIVILLVSILSLLVVLGLPIVKGNNVYVVLTASMEPTYPVGSLVVVSPATANEIQVGDVITFDAGSGFKALATHRVIEKHDETQEFITKGDNNRSTDIAPIPYQSLVGKAQYGIPYLGYFVNFIKTPMGIMACAAFLAVMVMLFVLPDIFKKDEKPKDPNKEEVIS